MSLLVVGSVAFDSVETPVDKIDKALGGSATFCSVASSYFSDDVKMSGGVGEDFGEQNIEMLKNHKIDISGLDIVEGEKTFSYGCVYRDDMNVRDTLFTDLNVFEKFDPIIPEDMRGIPYVLLGNIMPSLQLKVLDQMTNLKFSVCDTMNLWINITREDLLKVIKRVNLLVINDSEAKMLADEGNLIKAAKKVMAMGPEYLIIKKGEHGAFLFGEGQIFSAPAFPLETVFDPTGAGDSFAGGFTGHLINASEINFETMKKAVIYGSTLASFCVEKFSTKGIENLSKETIEGRFKEFINLSRVD
ncbi:MAG: PfkB family carbohydrate kinase [Melioribacteraceae bacterium]|jgi:sugar/nucleoside kinase (ribokinase family)|nr:PfkB family carbohydrate kinase [Melioribacteraceae bacterium]